MAFSKLHRVFAQHHSQPRYNSSASRRLIIVHCRYFPASVRDIPARWYYRVGQLHFFGFFRTERGRTSARVNGPLGRLAGFSQILNSACTLSITARCGQIGRNPCGSINGSRCPNSSLPPQTGAVHQTARSDPAPAVNGTGARYFANG